ncbi:MAG: hypothetical protein RIR00_1691, partial [Pseudomonadota bacterium]
MRVMEIIGIKGNRLYTVAPSQTLGEAITAMAELDAGSLVVMAAGKMVGMLTF